MGIIDRMAETQARFAATSPDATAQLAVPLTGKYKINRIYDLLASPEEAKLAEGGREFVEIVASMEPRQRLGLGNLLAEATGTTARAVRNSLHGMKYGYYLPNLPYLSYKALSLPVVSLATVGAARTLRATARTLKEAPKTFAAAVQDAFGIMPKGRVFGAAIKTPSGVTYSPAQVESLINQYGIGLSEVDTVRRASLADDLLRDAQLAAAGRGGKLAGAFSAKPWVKSFWLRYAEAVELSYRRAVFEGALANGVSPLEASDLARRSLFDYNEVPDVVRQQISTIFAGAATDYAVMNELVAQVVANPRVFTVAAKAKLAQQKDNDPYGFYGDKGLKALGIYPLPNKAGEAYVYGPEVPIFAPVEDALSLISGASKALATVYKAGKLLSQLDLSATVQEVGRVGLEGAQAAVDRYYPTVLRAFDTDTDTGVGKDSITRTNELSDEQFFWAALLAADIAERRGNPGIRAEVERLLDPQIVPPPPELAYVGKEGYKDKWLAQPTRGVPHLYAGVSAANHPIYEVFKPSPRGLSNIKAIRALMLPQAAESFIGPAVSIADAYYNAGGTVTVAPLFPSGLAGAAAQLAGLPPAPTPEQRRLEMEQGIRAVRESN